MKYQRIGVMCGSSDVCDNHFLEMAYDLGALLGRLGHDVVYGGGAKGLMRRVADGALSQNAKVYGYMPKFMIDVEWQHKGLTELFMTEDMHDRKFRMLNESDATLFLPGGCGTMEEFFEWLTSKRLGKYSGPLIIVNHKGYYDPLIELLNRMQYEKFHAPIHKDMWSVANSIELVPQVLEDAPTWSKDAIKHAAVK